MSNADDIEYLVRTAFLAMQRPFDWERDVPPGDLGIRVFPPVVGPGRGTPIAIASFLRAINPGED